MSSSRVGPVRSRTGRGPGEVDDDGDVLVTAAGVPPHVLIHPDHADAVEALLILDQDSAPLVEDRGVRGVPRHPEPFGNTGHGQVLADDAFQRPPQPVPGSFARGSAALVVSLW